MAKEARVALVTGASRGIGRAIALRLAELGWGVGINFLQNQAAAEEVLEKTRSLGRKAVLCQGDVSASEGRKRVLGALRETFGRLDALVNNAGMAPRLRRDLLEVEEESFDEVMATNLKGPFFLACESARWMLQIRKTHPDRPLHIVNISSISEYTASPNRGEYCVAKAAMGMMTRLFAERLANEGIQVNEVRPGIIATDMTAAVKEKYDVLISEGLTPIRRWGTPQDVALAVGSILEGHFPFSAGAAFDVDGGFHIRKL